MPALRLPVAIDAAARTAVRACITFAILLALAGCGREARAQDDGARLYMMTPAHLTIASLRLHYLDSNLAADPASINETGKQRTALGVFQFVQEMKVAGTQSFIFLVVPASRIEMTTGPADARTSEAVSGLGDVQLGYVIGIVGTPSLPAAAYAEHRPGLAVNLLGKLFFPTGAYQADRRMNVGANRWAVRLGVPIVYAIGERMSDPHLATIELMPTITFFGANDAPFGGGTTKQKPLFILEGHATRGLARNFWASFDLLWRRGGEVATDGVGAGNSQRALSLGATGTLALGRSSSLRLTYGKVVDRNAHGPNGWILRTIIGFVF